MLPGAFEKKRDWRALQTQLGELEEGLDEQLRAVIAQIDAIQAGLFSEFSSLGRLG